jgi:Tol biopolymer transport system component
VTAVLGIDAAWTVGQTRGVRLTAERSKRRGYATGPLSAKAPALPAGSGIDCATRERPPVDPARTRAGECRAFPARPSFVRFISCLLAATLAAAPAAAREVVSLVSRHASTPGVSNSNGGCGTSFSEDGRWMAFCSDGTDHVAGIRDANALSDVFLHDRQDGSTRLITRRWNDPTRSAEPWPGSSAPTARIAPDGSAVYFRAASTDLTAEGGNGFLQFYRYDIASGETQLLTRQAGGNAPSNGDLVDYEEATPSYLISQDGARVVFLSRATDLVAGVTDTNEWDDAFVYEPAAGTLRLASRGHADPALAAGAYLGDLSADGRYLAYTRGSDLALVRVALETLVPRIVLDKGPELVAGDNARLSADGAVMLFRSRRRDLVPAQVDTEYSQDLFLWSAASDSFRLVTHAAGLPLQTGNGEPPSGGMRLDDSGRYVVYTTEATNHTAGVADTNGVTDVLRFDAQTGETVLLSRTENTSSTGSHRTTLLGVRPDSSAVMLRTSSPLKAGDVYSSTPHAYEWTPGGGLTRISGLPQGQLGLPDPARCYHFGFVPGVATYRGWCYWAQLGGERPVQVRLDGGVASFLLPVAPDAPAVQAMGGRTSSPQQMSGDGRRVVYEYAGLYWRVDDEGLAAEIDLGVPARITRLQLSDAGSALAFSTGVDVFNANLYWHDLEAGATVPITSFPLGAETHCACTLLAISENGRRVLFSSSSRELAGGANAGAHVQLYVWDADDAATTLVTRRTPALGGLAMQSTAPYPAFLSGDGRVVAFESTDHRVAGIDGGVVRQVFLHDLQSGATELVSHRYDDSAAPLPNTAALHGVSHDGQIVLYATRATTGVVAASTYPTGAIVLKDRAAGVSKVVSHQPGNLASLVWLYQDGLSYAPRLSGDGRWIAMNGDTALVGGSGGSARALLFYDVEARQWRFGLRDTTGTPRTADLLDFSHGGESVLFAARGDGFTATPPPTNAHLSLYRLQRRGSKVTLVSHRADHDDVHTDPLSDNPVAELDRSGRIGLFTHYSRWLDPIDTNFASDVFRAVYMRYPGEVFSDGMEE